MRAWSVIRALCDAQNMCAPTKVGTIVKGWSERVRSVDRYYDQILPCVPGGPKGPSGPGSPTDPLGPTTEAPWLPGGPISPVEP